MFNHNGHVIPYITGASCINDGDILITRWTETPITISIFDDLIISCKGTIGKLAFNKIGDCHIARQLMAIRFFSKAVEKKFVKLFLASYVNNLIIQAKSMIPGISREDVLFAPLPLPPLAEQQRIVAKIDELITLCEQLKNIDPDSALPLPDMQQLLPPLEIPPSSELEEQYAMAARGDVSTTETKEHRQAIEDLHIPHDPSVSAWVSVSIGGVTVIPETEKSYASYLKIADTMLYDAKKSGRNRVIWADEKMKKKKEK